MRKIYIDCGAHKGDTIEDFVKVNHGFEIFAFEPNPYSKVHKRYGNTYTIFNVATWISDGVMPFYIEKPKEGTVAGTLFKEKRTGKLDKKHPLMVTTIDFSKWILDTFKPDDYIVLKLDIEGAEYKILPKMITDGSILYIDKLFFETHEVQLGWSLTEFIDLMSKLKSISTFDYLKDGKKWEIGFKKDMVNA